MARATKPAAGGLPPSLPATPVIDNGSFAIAHTTW